MCVTALATPPVPIPAHAIGAPALSAEHLRQLAAAHAAAGKVRRAVAVARVDGWGVATFGALTLLLGFTSVSAALLGSAMLLIGVIELRAAGRLRQLDPKAPRVLGLNQLALAGVLASYAAWGIYRTLAGPSEYAALVASEPQLGQMLGPVEDLSRLIAICIYGGLIAVAAFAQGGLSLFYFSRTKHVREYLAQTPEWVVSIQRAGRLV